MQKQPFDWIPLVLLILVEIGLIVLGFLVFLATVGGRWG